MKNLVQIFKFRDIDIDLAPSKRPYIFKKIREERGELGLVQVATFGTEGTKSAVLTACFKKGTKVQTLSGEKNIEEITTNDFVWTTNGYEKVISPTQNLKDRILSFRTRNSTNKFLECTDDHEILTISKVHAGRVEGVFDRGKVEEFYPEFKREKSTTTLYQRIFGYWREIRPIWKKAKDINGKNDYGLRRLDLRVEDNEFFEWENNFSRNFGIGISEKIPINNNFCELIGIWLAEGSFCAAGSTLTFTIHQAEEAFKNRIIYLMWDVFKLDNVAIRSKKDSLGMDICYSSRQLVECFKQLFEVENLKDINQWNKFVPPILKYIDPKKQMQIFKGWFVGDGWASAPEASKTEGKGVTVSKKLADDLIFILNRNFINPYIQVEERSADNHRVAYNIMFYSNKVNVLHQMKYKSNLTDTFAFPLETLTQMDFPVAYNGNYYLKTRIELEHTSVKPQEVYCLMVNSQNFTVNGTIVHNCRGYRSENFPDGIDVDQAQYMSSLIPSERGFLWPIKDVVYGNPEKGRKPVSDFVREVNNYPGLLDIIISIEGLINKRSTHASGVILYDEDPYEMAAFMRTPGGDIITCYDLHDLESAGSTKYDFLVTEISDKIIVCLELLKKDGLVENNFSLRDLYNKYLHPESLDTSRQDIWDRLEAGDVLDVFQFSTGVGLAVAKKLAPQNPFEMTAANAINLLSLYTFPC